MVKVMIVENSAKPCFSLKNLLPSINFDIAFKTSNGFEAIEKYDTINPDLLLLDLILSKGDGKNVLKEIKKTHPTSKIIIITLQSNKKLIEECSDLGAEACFTIPYKLKEFVTFVTNVIDSSKTKSKVAPVIID
ncbi:MAG: response regulator [Nitrosopumilus sp.]|nr:response regulator [Nitrosopumilus sp.]